MDRLSQTIKAPEFQGEKFREFSKEYLNDFLTFIEDDIYSELTKRVNWLLSAKPAIEAHTAADTLKENESGSVHSNLGATGAVTLTLPASASKGVHYYFAVQAAQELRIDPGTATIRDTSGQTAEKYKTANAIGECIHIIADANGDWQTISKYGTWTEEA